MKKRFRDRRDARRVDDIDGIHSLMVHICQRRCDSDVYINKKLDVTELVKYIEKNKNKDEIKLTYFHAFSTAIAKTVYNRPLLNRYVKHRRFYDRNEVTIAFAAKSDFNDEAKEHVSVVSVENNDNIDSIKTKISGKVKKVRTGNNNSTDSIIDKVGKLPVFLVKIIVFFVKLLDEFDLLPKSFIEDDVYHSTVIMSNLGSLKSDAIYHHLADFGTNSIVVTIGEIKKEQYIDESDNLKERQVCEFGINLDERIADGVYFVKSVKLLEYILMNPELLEGKANEKIKEELKIR